MVTIPGKWHRSKRKWLKMRPEVKRLRRQATPTERVLWKHLRKGQLRNYKFRRQHPVAHFVVDFCCPEVRLVVELDGPIHEGQQEKDKVRQMYLEQLGYTVIRFLNEEVIFHIDAVLNQIEQVAMNQK